MHPGSATVHCGVSVVSPSWPQGRQGVCSLHYPASWESRWHNTGLGIDQIQNSKCAFYWTHVAFAQMSSQKLLSQTIIRCRTVCNPSFSTVPNIPSFPCMSPLPLSRSDKRAICELVNTPNYLFFQSTPLSTCVFLGRNLSSVLATLVSQFPPVLS